MRDHDHDHDRDGVQSGVSFGGFFKVSLAAKGETSKCPGVERERDGKGKKKKILGDVMICPEQPPTDKSSSIDNCQCRGDEKFGGSGLGVGRLEFRVGFGGGEVKGELSEEGERNEGD